MSKSNDKKRINSTIVVNLAELLSFPAADTDPRLMARQFYMVCIFISKSAQGTPTAVARFEPETGMFRFHFAFIPIWSRSSDANKTVRNLRTTSNTTASDRCSYCVVRTTRRALFRILFSITPFPAHNTLLGIAFIYHFVLGILPSA